MTAVTFRPPQRAFDPIAIMRPDEINGRKCYWVCVECGTTGARLWHGGWPIWQKKAAEMRLREAMSARPWEKRGQP